MPKCLIAKGKRKWGILASVCIFMQVTYLCHSHFGAFYQPPCIYYDISITEWFMDPVKVPKEAEDLKKAASYRTKNRFPVLSWVHPESGAALIRSSQPTVGINDKV